MPRGAGGSSDDRRDRQAQRAFRIIGILMNVVRFVRSAGDVLGRVHTNVATHLQVEGRKIDHPRAIVPHPISFDTNAAGLHQQVPNLTQVLAETSGRLTGETTIVRAKRRQMLKKLRSCPLPLGLFSHQFADRTTNAVAADTLPGDLGVVVRVRSGGDW